MTSTPNPPIRRFRETGAATIDVNKPPRPAISSYANQEVLIYGFRVLDGPHGKYLAIRIQRRGAKSEEVQTSGEMIWDQLEAVEDWESGPIQCWIRQKAGSAGKPGMLYFADEGPEPDLKAGPVGRKGD